jgi:hypothetical protein
MPVIILFPLPTQPEAGGGPAEVPRLIQGLEEGCEFILVFDDGSCSA